MNPTRTTTTCITRPSRAGQDSAAATVKIDTAVMTDIVVYQRLSKISGNFFFFSRKFVLLDNELPWMGTNRLSSSCCL